MDKGGGSDRGSEAAEHSLKTECPTRWGSRQAMVDRVLEQQKAIAQVFSLTWQDTDVLEAINKSLSSVMPFLERSVFLS